MTEPLFYNDNIQVGNNTILHRRWIERVSVTSIIFYMNMELFLHLEEFNTKYGLNTDFVTYNGCVQAVKKYIKGLDIAVQSNKSLNMRKSLTLIANQSAALNGTAYSLTILTGLQPFTKLF